MALDNAFFLRIKGHIGPHDSDTELWYATDLSFPAADPHQFIDDWKAAVWTAEWKPLASDQFILDTLSGHFYDNVSGTGPEYTDYVNEAGTNTDEALPPWITVNITKVPDLSTAIPGGAEWRSGFVGMPGLPEISQVNGYLTDSALAAWGAVATAIQTITYSVTPNPVYKLGMYRFGPSPAAGRVVTSSTWVKQRTGTRNSRKKL